MTVLDDLWYGNISPSEQFLIGNTHFKELVSVMATDREKLSENFTADQNEWLEKYDKFRNACVRENERLYHEYYG